MLPVQTKQMRNTGVAPFLPCLDSLALHGYSKNSRDGRTWHPYGLWKTIYPQMPGARLRISGAWLMMLSRDRAHPGISSYCEGE